MWKASSQLPQPSASKLPCNRLPGAATTWQAANSYFRIDDVRGARRFRGGFDAARILVLERGVGELYRGLLATSLKQSATSAVRMGSYNVLKEQAKKHKLPSNNAVTFGMGAVAGIITVYATQPFDTIKTKTQTASGASTTQAVREIWRQKGVKGFWSGSTMRLGRLVFSGGIVFTVYEAMANALSGQAFS